jgi:hypothetical protein
MQTQQTELTFGRIAIEKPKQAKTNFPRRISSVFAL